MLLAPYRSLGLVTATLEGISEAVAHVMQQNGAGNGLRIEWVYAHVWTENKEGLAWYERRGFEKDGVLEKYYWKLQPDSAWVLKKRVGLNSKNGSSSQRAQEAQESVTEVPASVTAAAVNLPSFGATQTPPPTTTGPPKATASRPPAQPSGLSFQNKRPDMEWNDLPEDMVSNSKNSSKSDLLAPPSSSSRSSSTGRKKKDRAYPTAAFGA